MSRPLYDVVGVGANSLDYVYRLPSHPTPHGVSKVPISSHRRSAGGQTATTLAACAAFGRAAKYVGTFGTDENGTFVRSALESHGVDTRNAAVRASANAYAVILLSEQDGERVVLWHREPELALRPAEIRPDLIARARLLHVDDVDQEGAIVAARIAADAGVPTTSDIDRVTPRTMELVEAVSVAIFAEHVPTELTGETDPERALRALRRHQDGMLCVTRGERGALLLDPRGRLHTASAYPVTVVDSTGAGDVFRAGFIYGVLREDEPADILRFANAAAALSCTREGAMGGIPTLDEVLALVSRA